MQGQPVQCSPPSRSATAGLLILAAGLVALRPAAGEPRPVAETGPNPSTPAEAGAVIGTITIDNGGVFDLDDPEEDKALYRLANRLHIATKPAVIEQQLLFATGEEYSSRDLEESERLLRSNRYIRDAKIEPVQSEDGVVDVRVTTSDVWTLMPRLSLSRSGGENSSGFGLKEANLLGSGTEVEAMFKSTVDRDSKTLKIVDRQFLTSWYQVRALYESNSDGDTRLFEIAKPFYALDTSAAHGVLVSTFDRVDSLYDRGEITGQFHHTGQQHEVLAGWSAGLSDGWVRRYTVGFGLQEDRFENVTGDLLPAAALPEDRNFVYPFVGVEILQDRFTTASNLDKIRQTEDCFLGTAFRAKVGYADTGLGSDRNALLFQASVETTFGRPDSQLLRLGSGLTTRWQSGRAENLVLSAGARYYRRQSDKRVFFAAAEATAGTDLDIDNQILLGGDNGLRGYPLRFQSGTRSALITLEQRYFTDWYPFHLFRVGGAIFFDAGRAWGGTTNHDGNETLLRDVGFGLRIGNPRSGLGSMTHIDVAFPLDGDKSIDSVQFLVSLKESF